MRWCGLNLKMSGVVVPARHMSSNGVLHRMTLRCWVKLGSDVVPLMVWRSCGTAEPCFEQVELGLAWLYICRLVILSLLI
jgi:hypothetical protein